MDLERLIRVSEDVHWNDLRTAGQGIMRLVACCEEVLKENKRFLSLQNSVLGFFKSSSEIRATPHVLMRCVAGLGVYKKYMLMFQYLKAL